MLTPDGELAGDIDRVMLMAIWARELNEKALVDNNPVIFAAMGKPTFSLHYAIAQAATEHWLKVGDQSFKARHYLSISPNSPKKSNKNDLIVQAKGALPYGDPRGELAARTKMAAALNKWYQLDSVFKPDHILFTVGDVGALHNVFAYLRSKAPGGRIIVPFPYYALYAGVDSQRNNLHPIYVMEEKGYRLTPKALQKSINSAKEAAKKDGHDISAFLFCDPNNPLGTVVSKQEWLEIAEILRQEPNTLIILDEVYAEMVLDGERNNSLVALAPDLRDRIVLMRSATKGLSAAGERMAIMTSFNKKIMAELLKHNISIVGHAPISLQHAYAEAMSAIDEIEHQNISEFYAAQVNLVYNRVKAMGAAMPDPAYRVEGTFYVLIDLSDLKGQPLNPKAKMALGEDYRPRIETDEQIAYHLLFEHNILIAPLSYYGISPNLGYLRITCSGGETELSKLCVEIEKALVKARVNKYESLMQVCDSWLNQIRTFDESAADELSLKFDDFIVNEENLDSYTAKDLKAKLDALSEFYNILKQQFSQVAGKDKGYVSNVCHIQTLFRSKLDAKRAQALQREKDLIAIEEWYQKEIAKHQKEMAKLGQIKSLAQESISTNRSSSLFSIFGDCLSKQTIELISMLDESITYSPKSKCNVS